VNRGVGETAVVAALPEPVVAVAAVVTHLGDPLLVGLLAATLAWRPRPPQLSRAHTTWMLVMVVLTAAVMVVLKTGIAAPRPPGATADGFGFPSGHTLMATVGYGALVWGRRRWSVVAVAVITVVGVSRVLIGAHYLVDVVAGWTLGLGLLMAGHRWIRTAGPQQAALAIAAVAAAATAVAAALSPWYTPGIGAAAVALALVIRREEERG